MSALAIVLLAISGAFGGLLALKHLTGYRQYCAICLAVSLTWATLLVGLWLDIWHTSLITGILMGQSTLGVYYLLEKRVPKRLLLFRLPALATLTAAAYSALTETIYWDALIVLAALWITIGALYAYRENPRLQAKAKALIECCGNW